MKNLVSIFGGHDANISFWNAKTNKYYTFWGIMTIAVVIGQIYVGSGYRHMSTSILELINKVNVNSYTN